MLLLRCGSVVLVCWEGAEVPSLLWLVVADWSWTSGCFPLLDCIVHYFVSFVNTFCNYLVSYLVNCLTIDIVSCILDVESKVMIC